jgi:hypothetical protein
MVVETTAEEFRHLRRSYNPERWRRVDDSRVFDLRIGEHAPAEQLRDVHAAWDCGETGTWYLNDGAGAATCEELKYLGLACGQPVESRRWPSRRRRPAHELRGVECRPWPSGSSSTCSCSVAARQGAPLLRASARTQRGRSASSRPGRTTRLSVLAVAERLAESL